MKLLTTTKMTATCPICGSKFEFIPKDIEDVDDPAFFESENDITCAGVTCPACEQSLTIKELQSTMQTETIPYSDPDEDEEPEEKHIRFGGRY